MADHEPVTHRFRPAVILVSAAVAGSILLATHDSNAKVTTRGVAATLRTLAHPGWVAAGDDALWLALTDNRTTVRTRPLLRLDLASGAVKQRLSLGGRATYLLHVDRRLLAWSSSTAAAVRGRASSSRWTGARAASWRAESSPG